MASSATPFSDTISPQAIELLSASGSQLVAQVGLDVVRGVVLDVLTGKNLRDSTEVLTRRRLTALNLAMLNFFIQGASTTNEFIAQLPHRATELLKRGHLTKADRWIAQWMLGLTDKAFQNVLRDDTHALSEYRDRYIAACQSAVESHAQLYGALTGEIALSSHVRAEINWLFMAYFLNTIGAQTLAIRGSEKSAYGKLFEKLVLGALLHILGFEQVVPPPTRFDRVFWLSLREERRESDATLLYTLGKGVRFDIGFIGRGNPEISLDKVSRFEREIQLGRRRFYMATVILVDRIGEKSRIERLAEEIDGTIIQMSGSYWPQQVAQVLHQRLGFDHELVTMSQESVGDYLKSKMPTVPLGDYIGLSNTWKQNIVRETAAEYNSEGDDIMSEQGE
jgi:hypothetical protein